MLTVATLLFFFSNTMNCSAESMPPVGRSLLDQVQQQVCQQLAPRYDTVSLKLIGQGSMTDEQMTNLVDVSRIELGAMRNGRLPVSVSWPTASGERRTNAIWFRVTATVSTWRARRDLRAEHVITPSDIEQVKIDVAAESPANPSPASTPVGKAILRSVRKNQVLAGDVLSEPALVKRNDRVVVKLSQAGLEVIARGTALTTGWRKDDVVQIQIAGAEATVTGKVANEGEVYVEM